MAEKIDYATILKSVAQSIEALKKDYPQLKDFSPEKNTDVSRLCIDYSYHTHAPEHRGGWTSGVPNPDADGVWFYLDFHDPDSMAQIHTQPVVPEWTLGKQMAFILMMEGERTKRLEPALWGILAAHGAKPKGAPLDEFGWGETVNGLASRISLPEGKLYKQGENIEVKVEFKNLSDKPIRLFDFVENQDADYFRGMTMGFFGGPGYYSLKADWCHPKLIELKPGKSWTFQHHFDGSAKFEATKTQAIRLHYNTEYIEKSFQVMQEYWKGSLISNPVKIIVREK